MLRISTSFKVVGFYLLGSHRRYKVLIYERIICMLVGLNWRVLGDFWKVEGVRRIESFL
jgi:hypothetical protein